MKFVRAFITLVTCVALASQSSYGLSLGSLDGVLEVAEERQGRSGSFTARTEGIYLPSPQPWLENWITRAAQEKAGLGTEMGIFMKHRASMKPRPKFEVRAL